jgi:putative endonuclease
MESRANVADTRRKLGQWGEEQAARYLEAQGCQVVAANWRCTAGEVDLVVRDGDRLAFVEVRTRRGRAFGTPEESITPTKLARMAAVAESYVYEEGWAGDWRLDVVAIRVRSGQAPGIEWYKSVSQ